MSFSLDLSNAIEGVKEDRDKIVRGTLAQLSATVIKRTPVGNPSLWAESSLPAPDGYVGGSLRGAWNASIGAPDFTTNKRKVAPKGTAAIARASKTANTIEPGQTFYLTNPLPYARRVEFGWSYRQAPQGMVRRTLVEAQQILDRQ